MIDLKRVLTSSQLPTVPVVAVRLLEASRNPRTDIQDVVKLVKTDPAITARILKSANSSAFGFKSPVTSIERAVPLLGTTVVTALTLSFSLVDASMTAGPLAEHYGEYWKQSIVQASAAEVFAEDRLPDRAADSFLAGLLLDLGRLALLKAVPNEYLPVLAEWQQKGRPLDEIETERLGVEHVGVGVELMRRWKLPDSLVAAMAFHHAPIEKLWVPAPDNAISTSENALKGVAAIAAAVGDLFCSTGKGSALERLRTLTGRLYGIAEPQLEQYLERTRSRIGKAGELFAVCFDGLSTSADLMAQASEQLAELAVREHVASTAVQAQFQVVERAKNELQSRNEELSRRAIRDALTGLYNRAFFAEALNTAIEAAARRATTVGLIFSDIDHFKRLNDTYGHPFGDQVLCGIAKIFSEVVRKGDIVARYGGEEFVVLAGESTESGLTKLSERLQQAIESAPFAFETKPVAVTVSIGAAIAIPPRKPDGVAQQLIATADEAMYESKRSGRNQVRLRSLIDGADRRLSNLINQKRFSRWLIQKQVSDLPSVSKALAQLNVGHPRIRALAQLLGFLTPAQVDHVRQQQEATGQRFGECAIACGFLSEDQLATLLAIQAEPPNLVATTLTTSGLLDKRHVDQLLLEYRASLNLADQAETAGCQVG